jgi:hypothetical protein
MLPFSHAAERDGWYHLVTGHESWFFFDTSPRRMWTLSRDDVVIRPRHQIQSKKWTFMLLRNPTGFYVADRFPNDTKMNSDYFVINVLIFLEQMIFPWRRTSHEKQLVASVDNALFTQVGIQQIGSKNMAFTACQANPIHLIWPLVTCTCFLPSKKNLNGFIWLTRTSFWVPTRSFEGSGSTRIESRISDLCAPSSKGKWR